MTIEKALELYKKSPASYIEVDRYIPYKGGFVLLGKDDGSIGIHHVFVSKDGKLRYTNPLIEHYNLDDIHEL